MSRLPDARTVRSLVVALALACLQGIVIGTILGASLVFLFGRLDEYLVPICEFDQSACQASLSRLPLPLPDVNPCECWRVV